MHIGQHIHLYGPHGIGKTLVARHALRTIPDTREAVYLSCVHFDTQYKVLRRLCEDLAGDELNSGHHTAHLHNEVAGILANQQSVIVLDDIDFLLMNDGNDLFYYLSRLTSDLNIIAISAYTPDLKTAIDERTHSSLQPHRLAIAPYTPQQYIRILEERIAGEIPQSVTNDALTHIASTTSDIRLGLIWLRRAAESTAEDSVITENNVIEAQKDVIRRYQITALTEFSRHHAIALKAIEQLAAETDRIFTGMVYARYETLCQYRGIDPFTTRRISDFLHHLELLGLVDVDHYRGGKHGKTRQIRLGTL
jgi:Cdc6-like AAA superfamily ATPase